MAEPAEARDEPDWGLVAVPEHGLGLLGDVAGLDVVELACGTAYFSAWLARAGARPVAIDLSPEQLRTARRMQARVGLAFPLLEADGERVPLRGQREIYRVRWPQGVEFHPSHGDWVRLLRSTGFAVEALHEVYAPPEADDHAFYEIVTQDWATRWPAEELWVAVRR